MRAESEGEKSRASVARMQSGVFLLLEACNRPCWTRFNFPGRGQLFPFKGEGRGFLHARRRRRNAGASLPSSLAACVVSGVCTPRFIFPSHALSAASGETSRQRPPLLVRHTPLLVGIEHRMRIPANRFPWTVKALPCMKNAQRLRQTRALPH
jgi:hypothetical protein